MDSPEDRQQLEITALKSIYDENFIEVPPPKAWKGAPRLPEFIIQVHHPDEQYASKIYFSLHTKFPKTYPTLASPTFTIQQPIMGLKPNEVQRLNSAIHAEAQRNKGIEVVFQIVTFAQDWILNNIAPPVEVSGSLATQMTQRAIAEEQAKKQREEAEAEEEQERAVQRAEELQEQIRADVERQQLERERFQKARKRAMSDATEVPPSEELLESTPTETFSPPLLWEGVEFNTVKLFHPKKEFLGTVWQAEPLVEENSVPFSLELLNIAFEARYYSTSQGRKKLRQMESEIQRLTHIRHINVLAVLAVKLVIPHSSGPPRLVILCEARPSVTLQDVLEDCDCLREDRAQDYLQQILFALSEIHMRELIHRGLIPKYIGLAPSPRPHESKRVKVFKVAYHVKLLDMHRSDSFGPDIPRHEEDLQLPDGWLPKDALDSPLLYTKCRDIHSAGVILLQMLLGRDVITRFPDPQSALRHASISPGLQQIALNMLLPVKKGSVTASSLLSDLSGAVLSSGSRSPVIPIVGPKTPMLHAFNGSPESDYFRAPPPGQRHSRWKEDWEELELLGKGAFGSVVKARNRIDGRIYAVKKIRLRASQSDSKIFREVNALSRLNHRFIVRYFTTWVETSELASTTTSSVNSDSGTSVPGSRETSKAGDDNDTDPFTFDLDDLGSESRHSFPSIRFTRSGSPESSSDELESDEVDDDPFLPEGLKRRRTITPSLPTVSRTLYIQMEYVERQTLKERIAEGLTEEEAWRLFQQILDALVHMSALGILHRDIKLTNIFIDGKGDCKVGDFGLATSSLAAVDPSDVSSTISNDTDMTLDVGTRLYIAPEVQSSRGGPRTHAKADMYSLGIVFFEMNYSFTTGAERIAVIEGLRNTKIFFPPTWETRRNRQRQIITWLLQHNPNDRPTALELSQSPLLPPRMEDDYFKHALKMMVKPDSPHLQSVLSTLFSQPAKPTRGFLYDAELELYDHATLNSIVQDRLSEIFRLHGAIDMEPALLMPVVNPEEDQTRAMFLDRHADVVSLPNNALTPFARLAAKANIRRIKRYHIGDIYRPNLTAGHPKALKTAVFDIITPDIENGPSAATAEAITIVNSCIDNFANLGSYEFHISHTKFFDIALSRVSQDLRAEVIKVLDQSKSSQSQKRSILLRKGIPRNIVDELEVLTDYDDDVDSILIRLEKVSPNLLSLLGDAIKDVKSTIQFAVAAGLNRPIYFYPLYMISSPTNYFKDGVCFQVVRRNKRSDVLAVGGRYDHIISRLNPLKLKSDSLVAVGVQISLDKITLALAAFQSASQKTILKEKRSYGYWSPRRCDVYVVSHQEGYLSDRLEIASWLWKNNISADLMYEFGLQNAEHENVVDQCSREGILFIVYPRPRTARKDQPAFKVKSVLRGTEYEVSRQELVPFLHQQIAEQKRIDASLSGVDAVSEGLPGSTSTKEVASSADVHLILPGDAKKQRKQTKQMFLDRAFEFGLELKNAVVQSGMPVIAIDVPSTVFEEMTKNSSWVTDEDPWKSILTGFPTLHTQYAQQIRDAVRKRKDDGLKFVILFAVREERASLLVLA
ncbi:non-specific serine/threonine protein kinase [Abortiporus biennis]